MAEYGQIRVCVVGAGKHFLSGISYYTCHLINTLAQSQQVSAILMRQLLPKVFYPGRKRVGANLASFEYDPTVRSYDGVDWYWLPSIFRALGLLFTERPEVVVFQWWSGTVLHSYLLLALTAKLRGAKIVVEFHEILDTGEARLPLARAYVRLFIPLLVRLADGFVAHSVYDRDLLQSSYKLADRPLALIPHGPYRYEQASIGRQERRNAPPTCCNLLFFGVIRPFKGLEDLISAFDSLPPESISQYRLTIVGETWEGWTLPLELIQRSEYRDRITLVNRYVSDEEVARFFAEADAVVLPYHRSSTSGPLHIAMSCGLPVVVTSVGGLVEAVAGYEGAILVPPGNPSALQVALLQVMGLCGKRYEDAHSWDQTAERYLALFETLGLSESPEHNRPQSWLAEAELHPQLQNVTHLSTRDGGHG